MKYENDVRTLLGRLRDFMLAYKQTQEEKIEKARQQAQKAQEELKTAQMQRAGDKASTTKATAEHRLAQGAVAASREKSGDDISIGMLGHSLAYAIEKTLGLHMGKLIGQRLVAGEEKSSVVDGNFEIIDDARKPMAGATASLPPSKPTFDVFSAKSPEAKGTGARRIAIARPGAPT